MWTIYAWCAYHLELFFWSLLVPTEEKLNVFLDNSVLWGGIFIYFCVHEEIHLKYFGVEELSPQPHPTPLASIATCVKYSV